MPTDITPNLFELQGDKLKVTYTTTSITGQPTFTLQQGRKTLNFDKNQIQTTKIAIGTLLTVTIETVPDLKTTAFSLLLPDVNMQDSTKVSIKTIGILTTSKTSIGGPKLVKGALQAYKTVNLSGNAKVVKF
jgi:hypothetical protein